MEQSKKYDDNIYEQKLIYLQNKVKKTENIALDIIEIIDEVDFIEYIHSKAINELKKFVNSYSGICSNKEVIFISLVIIALLDYDGNFYNGVRKKYSILYTNNRKEKIENKIREILAYYDKESNDITRHINIILFNTIVPKHYIHNFFEFIYDIYKINLECRLPENLDQEFRFAYEGIEKDLSSDRDDLDLKVSKKTYKLIKTTNYLLLNDKDTIIKLSKEVVNIIDRYIWYTDINIANSYFEFGFNKWINDFEKSYDENVEINELRSRWEPSFKLIDNDVYLAPPSHRIKPTYNYLDIRLEVLNDEELIFEDYRPEIIEIIGGYKINPQRIKLENPLGKIRYRFLSKDEVIYDSGSKLFRKILIFNESFHEIKNNRNYDGVAYFVHNEDNNKINNFYTTKHYYLSSKRVSTGETMPFKECLVNFSNLLSPKINGEKLDNCFILEDSSEKEIYVYSSIKSIIFECEEKAEPKEISINNDTCDISNYIVKREVCNKRVRIEINSFLDGMGIYSINIPNVHKFLFAYDEEFKTELEERENKEIKANLTTGLVNEKLSIIVDVSDILKSFFKFRIKDKIYRYYVEFDIALYRLSDGEWKEFSSDIWIDNIKPNTRLELYGSKYDDMIVYGMEEDKLFEKLSKKLIRKNRKRIINRTELKKSRQISYLDISSLLSYKNEYIYFYIEFIVNSMIIPEKIFVFNRCIMQSLETKYNAVNRTLLLLPSYKGKGNVYVKVKDESDNIIFNKNIKSHEFVKLDILESFKEYRISFYEKPKGLSFVKDRLIRSYTRSFFAYDDLLGKCFRINKVYFEDYLGESVEEKNCILNESYVLFYKKLENKVYIGNVFYTYLGRKKFLKNINPVIIEMCKDWFTGNYVETWISNYKTGDGLLLDVNEKIIIDNNECIIAPDISKFEIDTSTEVKI